MQCAAHSIQSMVKDALNSTLPTFKQHIFQSLAPFRNEEAKLHFEAAQKWEPLAAVRPVEVRWNSFFDAAKRQIDRWDSFVSAVSAVQWANSYYATPLGRKSCRALRSNEASRKGYRHCASRWFHDS